MALDGITLGFVKSELYGFLKGAKVEKVHQPSKNELVFIFRTREGAYRMYASCDGQSPRVHLTRYNLENPKTPPMLCMLLRKRLCGATLVDIKQVNNDRILILEFDGTTEIGDKTKYYVICEIMGQRSNIILCDIDYRIIDAVKRVDEEKSSVREILPGLKYELPPMQEKCNILTDMPQGKYDVITSNPPYIETDAIQTLQTEVKDFEPHLALDGGADGLIFYRRICEIAPKILNAHGMLVFEIGYNQANAVMKLMCDSFQNVKIIKDLCGNDRVAVGYKK